MFILLLTCESLVLCVCCGGVSGVCIGGQQEGKRQEGRPTVWGDCARPLPLVISQDEPGLARKGGRIPPAGRMGAGKSGHTASQGGGLGVACE